jgi:hypothetical protein
MYIITWTVLRSGGGSAASPSPFSGVVLGEGFSGYRLNTSEMLAENRGGMAIAHEYASAQTVHHLVYSSQLEHASFYFGRK